MTAYYNEHDKFAAAWLRELIADGLIAPGEVDERSIEDVRPDELAGFVQCHFFAGIGIWSLALRQAGWPDNLPVWTGSCPCQPFSAAGKGGGFDDERHLWPAFHWLIEQSGAPIVLGEQVASQDGLAWLNLVSADLEATGYAFGAVDTCAAGFGAPHIRQRLYWMADALPAGRAERRTSAGRGSLAGGGFAVSLADAANIGHERRGPARLGRNGPPHDSADCGLADTDGGNAGTERQQRSREQRQQPQDGGVGGVADASGERRDRKPVFLRERGQGQALSEAARTSSAVGARPGPLNGLWRDADWLCCTDGKWRPVESSSQPLADDRAIRRAVDAGGYACEEEGETIIRHFPLAQAGRFPNRVGLLRGAGNAINLAQATEFISAVMEVRAWKPEKLTDAA